MYNLTHGCCSSQKLTLSKMLARIQATKSLFWSFCNKQLSLSHRTLPRASTVHRITPAWTQVNLQSSASYLRANPQFWRHHFPESQIVQHSRLYPEALSKNHRDLQLQSRYLFSPTLKTCNAHALKVDSYEIFCMHSQPSRPLQQIRTWRSCSYANLTNALSALGAYNSV